MPIALTALRRQTGRATTSATIGAVAVLLLGAYQVDARLQSLAARLDCDAWANGYDRLSPCSVAGMFIRTCLTASRGQELTTSAPSTEMERECYCSDQLYSLLSTCTLCESNTSAVQTLVSWSHICGTASGNEIDASLPTDASSASISSDRISQGGSALVLNFKRAVEKRDGTQWNTLQIVVPIIAVLVTIIVCLVLFLLYQRRVQRKYHQIANPVQFVGSHVAHPMYSRTVSSMSTNSTSSLKRLQGAWTSATSHFRLGRSQSGVRSELEPVRTRQGERVEDWAIDGDVEEFQPPHSLVANASSSFVGSSTANATLNSHSSPAHPFQYAHPNPSANRNSFPLPLPQIQNTVTYDPANPSNGSSPTPLPNVRPMNGVSRSSPHLPRIQIMSTPAQRGFKIDDLDSTRSPDSDRRLRETMAGQSGLGLRLNGNTNPQSRSHSHVRDENGVVLISRTPGHDFEIISTIEGGDTNDTIAHSSNLDEVQAMFDDTDGPFSDSGFPPALSDTSGIAPVSMPPSTEGAGSPVEVRNAHDGQANGHHNQESLTPPSPPYDLGDGHGRQSSQSSPMRIPRPLRNDPVMLIPQAVRSAGYLPGGGTPRSSVISLPATNTNGDGSPTSINNLSPLTPPPPIRDPNTRDTAGSTYAAQVHSPSTSSNRPSVPSTTASSTAEYKVPNPFVRQWGPSGVVVGEERVGTPMRRPRSASFDLAD